MASARENQTLTAGQHAPDFRLDDLNGGQRTLSELRAEAPVFLAFI